MSSPYQEIEEAGLPAGRMISGSKLAPEGHRVFFNACIFDSKFRQVWFGDFDFETDSEKLQKVATALNEKLYVTREQPFRWEGLSKKQAKDKSDDRIEVFEP